MNPNKLEETITSLGKALESLSKEMKAEQDQLRAKMAIEMPEFVSEYDELMKGVWKGEKKAPEIAAWWKKYDHILKTKSQKNDLNKK